MSQLKRFMCAVVVLAFAAGPWVTVQAQQAATTVDLVFIVDESGSMTGEQEFVGAQIQAIDAALTGQGITNNQYALIGFGNNAIVPRTVAGFDTAANIATLFDLGANPFDHSGATEDGYAGINYALNSLLYRGGAAAAFVLVTDEDRDNTEPTLDFNTMLNLLQTQNVSLTSILDQEIWAPSDTVDSSGLVMNAAGDVSIADGTGGVTVETPGALQGGFGTTQADYSQLSQDLGACVADLNKLRLGGDVALSFTEAFLECLALTIKEQPPAPVGGGLAMIGQSELQRNVGRALDGSQGVGDELGVANAGIRALGDPALQRAALEALSGHEVLATVLIGHSIIEDLIANVGRYMTGRRSSRSTAMFLASLSPAEAATNAAMTRAALDGSHEQPRLTLSPYAAGAPQMAGNEDKRWGSFATGRLVWADHEETDDTAGGDSFTAGGTVGTDYRLTDGMILGLAVGFSDTDMDFDNADLDIEANTFALYASYAPDESWYIDTVLHFTYLDYDMARDIVVPGINVQADGETDARQFGAQLRAGYDFMVEDQFVVGPVGTLQYVYTDVDGFTETGAGNLSLVYDDNKSDTWLGKLGGQGSFFHDTDWGMLIAQLRASWVYVFEEGDDFGAAFSGAVATPFTIPIGEGYDSNYFEVGGGVAARINDDIVLFADYDVTLGHDYITAHFVTFGARLWW